MAVIDIAGTTIADNGVADNGVVERAVDEALLRAGLDPITPETLRALRGMAKTDMFNRLAPELDAADREVGDLPISADTHRPE